MSAETMTVRWADDLATAHESTVLRIDGDYLDVDFPDPNNEGVMVTTLHRSEVEVIGCASCGEVMDQDDCPKSERPCGHHCNHSWESDVCCWCGQTVGEDGPR
jgi:hypothetical protein